MNSENADSQNGLRSPAPKPWLWLILVIVVAAVIAWRYWNSRKPGTAAGIMEGVPPVQPVATQAVKTAKAPSVPPAPAVTNKASSPQLPADPVTSRKPDPSPAPAVKPGGVATNAPAEDPARALAEAKELEGRNEWVKARGRYRAVLKLTGDPALVAEAEARIGKITMELAMTPQPAPEKIFYVVQAGDSIDKIARKSGTTIDLIQESNMLKNPDLIKAGDRLCVLTGKFSVVVSKAKNDLELKLNGEFFKRYRVGTGKYSKTPSGTFAIGDKQKEPVWWRPDGEQVPYGNPENILGTRWMSIKAIGSTAAIKGYGIHGTWDESTIGKPESAGCIRMKNSDVEELYRLLPVNTPVTITD